MVSGFLGKRRDDLYDWILKQVQDDKIDAGSAT